MSIETWFQKDSRISFERNWDIRDVKSGRRLGMATRCCPVSRAQGVDVAKLLMAQHHLSCPASPACRSSAFRTSQAAVGPAAAGRQWQTQHLLCVRSQSCQEEATLDTPELPYTFIIVLDPES